MVQKIKENFHFVVLAFLILIFFRQCGANRDMDKINKEDKAIKTELVKANEKIDSLNTYISTHTLNKEEMRKEMTVVMFEFLIYEDDFDHKRISLSEIKEKIKENEK